MILSHDKGWLLEILGRMEHFLSTELGLIIHPDKIYLQTLASGVDFLGWVNFPRHRVVRASTRNRMFRRLVETGNGASFASYQGLLSHGSTLKIQKQLATLRWLLADKI